MRAPRRNARRYRVRGHTASTPRTRFGRRHERSRLDRTLFVESVLQSAGRSRGPCGDRAGRGNPALHLVRVADFPPTAGGLFSKEKESDSDSASLGSNPSPPATCLKRPGRKVCDPRSGPASGSERLQNFVSKPSRKITVNAAINPHSVAVKPSSLFRRRRKIPNIPAPNYRLVRGKPKADYG